MSHKNLSVKIKNPKFFRNKLKDKEVQGNSVAQVMHIVNKEFGKEVVKGVLYLRKETIPRRY